MNGINEYEQKIINNIDRIIRDNPDKPYLRGYYNYIVGNHTYSTCYNYLFYVVGFMNSCKKQVKTLEFDDYTNYLSDIRHKSSTLQIATYSALKLFSTYLLASKKCTDDPMQLIHRPKFVETEKTKEKREAGYLEPREVKRYLRQIDTGAGSERSISLQNKWKERDKLIAVILLTTGIRCSALYKLDIDSINLETNQLVTRDKGDKPKFCELNDEVMVYVKQWLNKREIILEGKNEDALFISNRKTRMDQASIYRIVNKYAENIHGKKISPHKLRATYGTQLYNKTKDIYFVQDAMGHANPQTTELYIRGVKNTNSKTATDIMTSLF